MRNFSKITAVVFAAVAVLVLSTVSFARGWEQHGGQWYFTDGSGEFVTNAIKTSGTTKYYLGEDGAMVTNTFVEDYNDYSYYFGANGAMVTNTWVAVDPSILSSVDDDAPSAYWFYFGTNGKAYKAGSSKAVSIKTIDGNKYAFDENGHMLTGWISADDGKIGEDEDDPFVEATYFAGGENDGVLRKGWHAYVDGVTDSDSWNMNDYGDGDDGSAFDPSDADVLWFYFQTSNCKMLKSDVDGRLRTKKINGKTYAFTKEGFMFEGWTRAASVAQTNANYYQRKFYNGATGGNLTKKGWIFEVPSAKMFYNDYVDDEQRWFYADGSGKTVVNSTKKVNGKYYIFDESGIMRKGLVLTTSGNKYLATVKLDETDGKRFIAHDAFVVDTGAGFVGGGSPSTFSFDGTAYDFAYADWDGQAAGAGKSNRFFYFRDSDNGGDRQTGTLTLEFADNDYTFISNNSGGYMGGKNNNSRFYINGIALKANPDVKYGIVARNNKEKAVNIYLPNGTLSDYDPAAGTAGGTGAVLLSDVVNQCLVVSSSGSKIKKNAIKKDGNDNYWVINSGLFQGVYTVQVKLSQGFYQFKSDFYKANGEDTTSGWGWCYHRGDMGYTNHTGADGSPFTASTIGSANQWSYDLNRKTVVYPMISRNNGGTAWTTVESHLQGETCDMDFNATLDDDMAIDFYWLDTEK